ncbi:YbaB/EbfC family nucleoid-associated protein [Actinoplanes sp. TBRC 11911]|uniref:YbaB/EbfC family nucleoid-associated protein n=1 Tax=Actinoplanes sp. TBRC 11911 TaxID=2729386 RepID=UPI00145F3CF8|nr:YbaB/EbfC family nucleoid-associated protein [Actinoplanes sp. TBRC 11911]NMO56932.1 YbaB/EbfC family nucleoid-associated protein [Actinoplanes sp. TBRC 11911]
MDRIERLFEEYQRQRDNLSDMQRRMSEISASATSPRREVTVTVGQNGVLTDIQFANGAYRRMTPADLTAVVLATFNEAKEAAFEEATRILAPMLPDGVDAAAMVRGKEGVDAYMPKEPRMATSVREILGIRETQE